MRRKRDLQQLLRVCKVKNKTFVLQTLENVSFFKLVKLGGLVKHADSPSSVVQDNIS